MGLASDREIPWLLGRGMSMSQQLAGHARISGDSAAFVFEDTLGTFRETDERVNRLANALRSGIEPGDRVVLCTLNCLEAVVTYFAAARLGRCASLRTSG